MLQGSTRILSSRCSLTRCFARSKRSWAARLRLDRPSPRVTRAKNHPVTPDGRYFVVNGRLWRTSDPNLSEHARQTWTAKLMAARRQVGLALKSGDIVALKAARAAVDAAKRALGERGPVWWTDGAPDLNRHMVTHTSYKRWYEELQPGQ